jgi:hypothetical protein
MLFFLTNCSDDGWSKNRIKKLENECVENASNQILDEKKLFDTCSCVSSVFTSEFSWKEYEEMLSIRITNENNPELSSKLQVYISSVMKDCNISL